MKSDARATEIEPVRIGVSACLLGEKVRHDGGHKKNDFLTGTLSPFVTWVPVCPEVELGLGTPRPTLRLIAVDGDIRMIESAKARSNEPAGIDRTDAMRAWAQQKVRALARMRLSGYVLKKDSPSCGMERVKLYSAKGMPTRKGRGLFAQALIDATANLPVEEEGRLTDLKIRENFIERVFAYRDLMRLFERRWDVRDLIAFHSAHKFQLLAHSTEAYRRLGAIVAKAKKSDRDTLSARYQSEFMAALRVPATRGRHANVLQHMAGYFKDRLDSPSRRELQDLIEEFRSGVAPLIVPLTLIRHYISRFDIGYLKGQVYLSPHPKELMLRNHV
ncbi:MAG TPA: DUF523 and DUF1722 domain-containing protein [Candidatus Binataceae bacterium]|nr:DUF523 and DUF1722 domain-containing protein [Candidatus Binataceae bacterium]